MLKLLVPCIGIFAFDVSTEEHKIIKVITIEERDPRHIARRRRSRFQKIPPYI